MQLVPAVSLLIGGLFGGIFLAGCKTSEFTEDPPAASYPPPAIPPAPAPAPVAAPRYSAPRPVVGGPIRVGDTIELFVEEDDSFNGKYPVREQGDIIIRSVGRIQVSGLTMSSAAARVKTELESRHLKKATVIIDRVSRAPLPQEISGGPAPAPVAQPKMTIYLNGSVNRAGQHRIEVPASGQLGVYEALLIGGGISKFGDPTKVHILRNDSEGKKQKIPVNISEIEKGLAKDPQIGNGDIVVVPERVFGF